MSFSLTTRKPTQEIKEPGMHRASLWTDAWQGVSELPRFALGSKPNKSMVARFEDEDGLRKFRNALANRSATYGKKQGERYTSTDPFTENGKHCTEVVAWVINAPAPAMVEEEEAPEEEVELS